MRISVQLPSYCFLQLWHPNTWWAGHMFKPQSCKLFCTGWSPPQWSHATEASRLAHEGQVQHTCKGCTLGAWKCMKLTWKPPNSELAWPHCDQPSPETKPDELLILPYAVISFGKRPECATHVPEVRSFKRRQVEFSQAQRTAIYLTKSTPRVAWGKDTESRMLAPSPPSSQLQPILI